jgi:hypothetical protein
MLAAGSQALSRKAVMRASSHPQVGLMDMRPSSVNVLVWVL